LTPPSLTGNPGGWGTRRFVAPPPRNIGKKRVRYVFAGATYRAREGLFSDDAFAFLDGYELPRGDFGEILGFAIEPADR
jgi:hypothetical protein